MSSYKLICPPDNWRHPLSLDVADLPQWREAARRLGLVLTVDEAAGKAYLGRGDRLQPAEPPPPLPPGDVLDVPYYSQRDSQTGQAGRMCFSSTCAMLTKFLKPGALSDSPNADDEYLGRVQQYGDTTEASAQLAALRHFGIEAEFRQNLSWADVDAQLRAGIPVPIGWLIWGSVSAPSGGGHWSLIVGKAGNSYRVHDPYGECDLVGGGYLHPDGKSRLYSRTNLGPRWQVEGPGTGWGLIVA